MIILYQEDGWERIELRNECLSIRCLPELGGKLISVFDRRTGREWMDHPSGRAFRRPIYGSKWEEWDRCGWDELFPSIDPCPYPVHPWKGIDVPDHGELWCVPWQHEVMGPECLRLSVHGIRWPYTLAKTVTLKEDTLSFVYRLCNHSQFPMPYIWAPHPIMAANSSLRIVLPTEVKSIVCAYSAGERLGKPGQEHPWPLAEADGKRIDLSRMPEKRDGIAEKWYVQPPLAEGWCEVKDEETGEAVRFEFDTSQLPYLGIWMNAGGWNGEYHLAVEPSTGYMDHLANAYSGNHCTEVGGLDTKEWEFRVQWRSCDGNK